MARNRTMAAKHDKAKKCMMEEVMDNARHEMCCKTISSGITYDFHHDSYLHEDSIFYSRYAIQRRMDSFAGKHVTAEEFRQEWGDNVYEYIKNHTVPETLKRMFFAWGQTQ